MGIVVSLCCSFGFIVHFSIVSFNELSADKPLPLGDGNITSNTQILTYFLQIQVSCNYLLLCLLLLRLQIWRQLVNFETAGEIISVLHCTSGRRMEFHLFFHMLTKISSFQRTMMSPANEQNISC